MQINMFNRQSWPIPFVLTWPRLHRHQICEEDVSSEETWIFQPRNDRMIILFKILGRLGRENANAPRGAGACGDSLKFTAF
jgi:hypothetical protein